jgi:signal transduction histidine kinase
LDHALIGQAQSAFVHKPVSNGTLATILATYVPIHPAGGAAAAPKVLGAFAIEQDLSAILAQLQREQLLIAGLVGALMLALLIALLLAIRWAGGIMRAQHTELLNRHTALVDLQQVRDDLTRLIVHDLRNPLTAIAGYLDIPGDERGR